MSICSYLCPLFHYHPQWRFLIFILLVLVSFLLYSPFSSKMVDFAHQLCCLLIGPHARAKDEQLHASTLPFNHLVDQGLKRQKENRILLVCFWIVFYESRMSSFHGLSSYYWVEQGRWLSMQLEAHIHLLLVLLGV